uniref:Uncharacterized protein n=1 Tax=Eutreptiella gymnastica TaxID=73025 RepID=A0A7S1N3B4_9EUGL
MVTAITAPGRAPPSTPRPQPKTPGPTLGPRGVQMGGWVVGWRSTPQLLNGLAWNPHSGPEVGLPVSSDPGNICPWVACTHTVHTVQSVPPCVSNGNFEGASEGWAHLSCPVGLRACSLLAACLLAP